MSIRIANLNNPKLTPSEVLISINRSTPVGNPWFIGGNTSPQHRTDVCNKFKNYFYRILDDTTTSESLTEHYGFTVNKKEFINYIKHIYKMARTQNVVLGCHCYPLQCHGEVIQEYVQVLLREEE